MQQQRDALNAAAAQSQAAVQAQAETFGRSLFTGQVNDGSISNTQFVTNLYEAFLQRGPDAGGLSFWAGQASVGSGRQNVLNAFATCSAFRDLSGTLYREANWLVADHLGTPRMIVNKSGALASMKRRDYLPFGEELFSGIGGRTPTQGYSGDSVRQKFTSKERDTETGLDYFGARFFSSIQGRFTGVDPSMISIHLGNPQSWNRYSYTYNNPVAFVDENGKWPTWIHNLIIDRAFKGLSSSQRKEIKNGSWDVDHCRKCQSAAQSYQHGMTAPGESQAEAAEKADQFINDNVDNAKWNYEHHGLTSSLYDFGRAFHTVSDMTSPAHEGYQVWNGGVLHPYSTGYHRGEEASISYFRLGLAIGATMELYGYTYGQQELQRATGYTPGSANDPTVEAIEHEFSLPGADPAGEGEALWDYRMGLHEGLNFDWGRQRGRRGRRTWEPR